MFGKKIKTFVLVELACWPRRIYVYEIRGVEVIYGTYVPFTIKILLKENTPPLK